MKSCDICSFRFKEGEYASPEEIGVAIAYREVLFNYFDSIDFPSQVMKAIADSFLYGNGYIFIPTKH